MIAPNPSSNETSQPKARVPAPADGLARLAQPSNRGPRAPEPPGPEPTAPGEGSLPRADPAGWPILICMLGDFRLLQAGQRIAIRSGGKLEALLCYLGLHYGSAIAHATLVHALWPSGDPALGAQSLNSLIYQLHKLVGSGPGDARLIVHDDGQYRLNAEAGVGVDVTWFEHLVEIGEKQARSGDQLAALAAYSRAVEIYRGDLCVATDVQAILVRERLRSRYLTLLARIADHHYNEGDYMACLRVAWRLLEEDPCREDAHRLVMCCYVKRGERAAALRHYQTCVEILRTEIDIEPEPATKALLELIRRHPELI